MTIPPIAPPLSFEELDETSSEAAIDDEDELGLELIEEEVDEEVEEGPADEVVLTVVDEQ